MGGVIVSIVIFVLLGVFLIIGYVKGFLNQLLGFVGGFVALIIALLLCRPIANIVFSNTNWMDALALKIADVFHLPDTNVEAQNLTAALTEMNYPAFMQTSIVKLAESMNEATVNLSIVISQTIARFIIIAICFVVIFIGLRLLVLLLKGLAKVFTKLPIVGPVDKVLGMVLGLIKGLVALYTILFLISIIPFGFLEPVRAAIAASAVATFFTKFNLIAIVLAWIAMI